MIRSCLLFGLFLLVIFTSNPSASDYYQWKTAHGTEFFSDKPKAVLFPGGEDTPPARPALSWPDRRQTSYASTLETTWQRPGTASETPRTATPDKAKRFANCTEAHAAGRYNIRRGDPEYASYLDRDNDGIACDK